MSTEPVFFLNFSLSNSWLSIIISCIPKEFLVQFTYLWHLHHSLPLLQNLSYLIFYSGEFSALSFCLLFFTALGSLVGQGWCIWDLPYTTVRSTFLARISFLKSNSLEEWASSESMAFLWVPLLNLKDFNLQFKSKNRSGNRFFLVVL